MHRLLWRFSDVCSDWAPDAVFAAAALFLWRALTHARHPLGPAGVSVFVIALVVLHALATSVRRRRAALIERVVVVGSGPLAALIVAEIDAHPEWPFRVVGLIDDPVRRGPARELATWLGGLDDLGSIISEAEPARIIIALTDRRDRVPELALLDARLRGVGIDEAVHFYERLTGKLAIEALTPRSLVLSDGFRHSDILPHSDLSLALTRLFSCLTAAALLMLLAPVLAVIAALVVIDSPGPIFFVQDRVGRGGRPFGLIKFRTMRQATNRSSEWVKDNAHRITRVGAWLRRFRLDELPQCWNVLKGEMNLVGPRPHPVSNYELFLEHIPYYGLRSAVRPGITGWAQVRYGYANGLEEETEKMRYDLYYIKHRSLWLDLRIVIDTVLVLAFDRRSHETVRRPAEGPWRRPAPGMASR